MSALAATSPEPYDAVREDEPQPIKQVVILPTRFNEPPPPQQFSQNMPNDKFPYILVPAPAPNFVNPAYYYGPPAMPQAMQPTMPQAMPSAMPTSIPATEPPKTTHKKRKSGSKIGSTKKPEINQFDSIEPNNQKVTNSKVPAVESKPMPSSSSDKVPQVQIVTPTKANENLVVPTEVIETSTDADKFKNRKPKFQ